MNYIVKYLICIIWLSVEISNFVIFNDIRKYILILKYISNIEYKLIITYAFGIWWNADYSKIVSFLHHLLQLYYILHNIYYWTNLMRLRCITSSMRLLLYFTLPYIYIINLILFQILDIDVWWLQVEYICYQTVPK